MCSLLLRLIIRLRHVMKVSRFSHGFIVWRDASRNTQGYFLRIECCRSVIYGSLFKSIIVWVRSGFVANSLTLHSSGTRPEAGEPLTFTLGLGKEKSWNHKMR